MSNLEDLSVAQDILPQRQRDTAEATDWPPPAGRPVDTEQLYASLTERGLQYGPAFRGLRRAWRNGEETCAEVSLGEGLGEHDYLVHPAMLDAALHAAVVPFIEAGDDRAYLPFAWRGVKLHGGGSRSIRVRVLTNGENSVSLSMTDEDGRPVATVDSLLVRPVAADQLGVKGAGQLLRVAWRPVRAAGPTRSERSRPVLLGADHLGLAAEGNSGRLATAHQTLKGFRNALVSAPAPATTLVCVDSAATVASATQRALILIQEFLADNRLTDGRLVFLTRRGVSTGATEAAPDLAASAVWGLVRAAQLEQPGRFGLVDLDEAWSWPALETALASGGPQLAVRGSSVLCPRLLPVSRALPVPRTAAGTTWAADRTVLITGGLGALGRLVALHLAGQGVRRLVLLSRRGPATPGADALQAQLAELGCQAEVVTCDVTDPAAVERVVSAIPAEFPLGAVVHAAGVTADGLVTSLTPRSLDTVLQAKLTAAQHLDRVTADDPQVTLVLFSSLAGVLGSAGQANYAAANAALDALALRRRAAGLRAVSLAWGPWEDGDGMASGLGAADRARMLRSGIAPISAEHGLALMDAALARNDAVLVAVRLDQESLRSGSAPLPEMLLDLAPHRGRVTASADDAELFRTELATLPAAEQQAALLDLVRREVAVVLGHDSAEAVDPDEQFPNLGFDSLTNLELIRRLSAATAVRLSNTLAFDHATSGRLAARLAELLT